MTPETRLQGRAGALMAFSVIAVAIAIVAILGTTLTGRGRDDFGSGSVAQLEAALRSQGLEVCSVSTPTPAPNSDTALSTQVLHVGLPPACTDGIDVQVNAYADAAHRDSAARNAEAQERQRNYGVVYTWREFAIYLQADDASGTTAVRDRVVDALDAVGAN